MKVFRKLGFNTKESAEIVTTLNILLANYQIHYQKLRNFHWNVEGDKFFELHKEFENEYNQVKLNIDEVAERIRVFGRKPFSTLKMYLEVAKIKEVHKKLSSEEMVEEILNDFEKLLSYMMDVANAAGEVGDIATEDMIVGFIKRMEKRHWMFNAFSMKKHESALVAQN